MNPKEKQNHSVYIEVLRNMTPEARLKKAFELSDMVKNLFRKGLRDLHPDLPEKEFQKLFLERLEKCHNRNW